MGKYDDEYSSDNDSDLSSTSSFSSREESRRRSDKKKKRKRDYKKRKSSKKRKKDSKKKKKRRKEHKSSRHRHERDDDSSDYSRSRKRQKKQSSSTSSILSNRHHLVAQALKDLLEKRPVFSSELPIILIRMVGGATFNLQQMNDGVASMGLKGVFESLVDFGVVQSSQGLWMFQAPGGAGRVQDELILLRIIRQLLDDIGLTMDAIESYEKEKQNKQVQQQESDHEEKIIIENSTTTLLTEFQNMDPNLGKQLAELCQTILDGESLCIDGLPNENLKSSLDSIFGLCGLEKSEMENDDSESDDDDKNEEEEETLMGYGLPEHNKDETILKVKTFMDACQKPLAPMPRRVLGPQRPTADNFSDDEGPAPVGAARKGPSLTPEQLMARMQKQDNSTQEGGREEWMINPGQHDFLSNIKAGQTIKSRGFRNQKAPEPEEQAPINPVIQKEMDDIVKLHKEARGPSLLIQHREKKQQEKMQASGKKEEWKWNRNNDLDAGRRVDKNALKMVLGGAATNLQTKFQGGFNR